MNEPKILLSARGISKSFPGVQALADVDLDIAAGEVHALMGENGAGKSTLIKIITGVYRPDDGRMTLSDRLYGPASPLDAQRRGISTVYQEINLVPSLSVAENLFAGRFPRRWFGIDWNRVRKRAGELMSRFELDIDVEEPLASYSVAVQQLVSIARAVDTDARLIVLDEPTSSLDRRETEKLFANICGLKTRGIAVVFITHFLDQVYEISDRITVLRNGRKVGTFDALRLPRLELVAHMLGRPLAQMSDGGAPASAGSSGEQAPGRPLLSARGLARRGAIEAFDLDIGRGEVLGLAGLLGSGRTTIARMLCGADRADHGSIRMDGQTAHIRSPRDAISLGIAMCPEDRKVDGIFPELSVRANIVIAVQGALARFGFVSRAAQRELAKRFVRELGISAADIEQPIRTLSGGNQQKAILARWLACRLDVLILDEPTRGIDIGAKAEIERLVQRLAAEGLAVLFISSELEEVVRRGHRVLVLRDRKIVAELRGDRVSGDAVVAAIAGRAELVSAPGESS